jgi:hypothetical protein
MLKNSFASVHVIIYAANNPVPKAERVIPMIKENGVSSRINDYPV